MPSCKTHLVLALADARLDDPPLDNFAVTRVAQGCPFEHPDGCGNASPPDDDMLHFTPGGDSVDVRTGQPAAWSPAGADGRVWNVRNLRSFDSGLCDDGCRFGYEITSP